MKKFKCWVGFSREDGCRLVSARTPKEAAVRYAERYLAMIEDDDQEVYVREGNGERALFGVTATLAYKAVELEDEEVV